MKWLDVMTTNCVKNVTQFIAVQIKGIVEVSSALFFYVPVCIKGVSEHGHRTCVVSGRHTI